MMLNKQNNPENLTEQYRLLKMQMTELLKEETDWVANLANASALLYNALPNINWVGFYLLKNGELILGPFQGKPACVHIPVGKGVCGTAVEHDATQIVPDVHCFEGHIACDSDSASELVIPLHSETERKVVGVLDIDSPVQNRFSNEDADALEEIAAIIAKSCIWSN
ncbi:MAG: Free methionine-R-sulfoxide reductase [Oscillospiraceae bacterium]|jgi:L-methionine (R)-S-oxide reductase